MDALFEFWFDPKNEHIWFTPSDEDDKQITTKFGYLINRLLPYTNETPLSTDPDELLLFILTFDQIARHVSRFFGEPYPDYYQKLAHKYAFRTLSLYPDLEPYLHTPKRVPFILLSYRHTKSITHINYVKCLSLRLLEKTDNSSYVRRFYQASVRQLGRQTEPSDAPPTLTSLQQSEIKDILDPESTQTLASPKRPPKKHPLLLALRATLPDNNPSLTLSVSGGKDSMALATALAHIHEENPSRFHLQAVHINYMNRPTATKEEHLVTHYVNHILKIPLKIRRINEIRRERSSKERRFYEDVTKEIRFRTYQQTDPTAYVILGHNEDDTIENIITNIGKKERYDNLLGMKTFTVYTPTQTRLYRPLLKISKAQIEDFNAHTNTPFTYDSTPDWSDRGRIRDIVVPTLKDFKPALIEGLAHLSKTLTTIYEGYTEYALPAILKELTTTTSTHLEIMYKPNIISDKVLRTIFDIHKIPQPSHKSLTNLLQLMNRKGHPPPKIKLTKELTLTVTPKRVISIPLT